MAATRRADLLVIKLGGSLLQTGRYAKLLDQLAAATRPLVIVPGGGPFADAVRVAQNKLRLDDATAHRLAILAMHQTAHVLLDMQPRLAVAETLIDIRRIVAKGRIPVWLPLKMADRDRDIPRDWTITADGLAARLAERMGAKSVVLIKSCSVAPGASWLSLVRGRVVDPVFGQIVNRACLDWRVIGPADEAALVEIIGGRTGKSRRR